ncbi:unnamed protein product, partial [Laminaria digitata]
GGPKAVGHPVIFSVCWMLRLAKKSSNASCHIFLVVRYLTPRPNCCHGKEHKTERFQPIHHYCLIFKSAWLGSYNMSIRGVPRRVLATIYRVLAKSGGKKARYSRVFG